MVLFVLLWIPLSDVDYHSKLSQVVVSIQAEVDMLSLLGQISKALGTCYVTTDFVNAFFLYSNQK